MKFLAFIFAFFISSSVKASTVSNNHESDTYDVIITSSLRHYDVNFDSNFEKSEFARKSLNNIFLILYLNYDISGWRK